MTTRPSPSVVLFFDIPGPPPGNKFYLASPIGVGLPACRPPGVPTRIFPPRASCPAPHWRFIQGHSRSFKAIQGHSSSRIFLSWGGQATGFTPGTQNLDPSPKNPTQSDQIRPNQTLQPKKRWHRGGGQITHPSPLSPTLDLGLGTLDIPRRQPPPKSNQTITNKEHTSK